MQRWLKNDLLKYRLGYLTILMIYFLNLRVSVLSDDETTKEQSVSTHSPCSHSETVCVRELLSELTGRAAVFQRGHMDVAKADGAFNSPLGEKNPLMMQSTRSLPPANHLSNYEKRCLWF